METSNDKQTKLSVGVSYNYQRRTETASKSRRDQYPWKGGGGVEERDNCQEVGFSVLREIVEELKGETETPKKE